ncbi:6680_t:CDS:2 [Funneliformis caledonium]|uniref:6680_t:CDS:1 n=1 Tax=Funneliformis caledonium TaxID=1117310 RepID=A0A9N8WBA4_9GLOM|nr:6680_t:CDS:2 [Funneliformis caledonium]
MSNNSDIKVIDLTDLNTTFDDNINYDDILKDESITNQPKSKKICINTLQDYVNLKNYIKVVLYQSINYYWKVPYKEEILQLKDTYQNMKNLTEED